MKKLSDAVVCKLSHELGLCTELQTREGEKIGVLGPSARAGDDADLLARMIRPGYWYVEAVTQDGVAFLELV